MSRKLRAPKYLLLDAIDTTTSPTSPETGVKQLDTIIYEIVVDAAVDATLEVEASTDKEESVTKTFYPLDFAQPTALVGATDTQYQIVIRDNPFTFCRLKITNNGGTGNITAHVSGVSKGA